MIVAIVLAAGESRRMGTPKPLLKIGDETFLERIVSALKKSRVGQTLVVLGHDADRVRAGACIDTEVVLNPDYRQGQLSSLQAGIRHVAAAGTPADAILVCLVDHPFIDAGLVDALITAFYQSDKPVVIPTHAGRRGHPVLFSSALFSELLGAPPEEGAKAVVRRHSDRVLEVAAPDAGILVDVDTPEIYRSLKNSG